MTFNDFELRIASDFSSQVVFLDHFSDGHKKTTMAISNFMTIIVDTFGHYMYCNNFIGNLFKYCLDHVHENDHGGLIRYDF